MQGILIVTQVSLPFHMVHLLRIDIKHYQGSFGFLCSQDCIYLRLTYEDHQFPRAYLVDSQTYQLEVIKIHQVLTLYCAYLFFGNLT